MSKLNIGIAGLGNVGSALVKTIEENKNYFFDKTCLLYTSPSPRDCT